MASNKASSSLDSAKPAEFHPKIKPAASRGSGGDGTFLGHILCEILVPNARSPLVLDRDISPTDAFRKLEESWVRAAPVRGEGVNEFLGTLDLQDACRYLVDLHSAEIIQRTESKKQVRKRRLSWLAEHPAVREALLAGSGTVEDLAKLRPFKTFKTSETLGPLCEALGNGSHIVGIVSEEGELLRIVTQGYLIRTLAPLLDKMSMPVKNLMTSHVISVNAIDTASHAFDIISNKNISGLAVLDEEGDVCNTISVSDVKMLIAAQDNPDSPVSLQQPCEEFLKFHRSAQATKMGMAKIAVAKVPADEETSKAIKIMIRTGYHHCWVVEDATSKLPIGVLSLTDIFRALPTMDHRGNSSMDRRGSRSFDSIKNIATKTCSIL